MLHDHNHPPYGFSLYLFPPLYIFAADNAEVHMRLGDAYREAGELGNAERHIRHATFMDPHFVLAFLNLARVHDQVEAVTHDGLKKKKNHFCLSANHRG